MPMLKEDISLNQAKQFLYRNGVKKLDDQNLEAGLKGKDPETAKKITSLFKLVVSHSPDVGPAKNNLQGNDYKAWVNVETNEVNAFDAHKSYYDGIRQFPKLFGQYFNKGLTPLRSRIAMEQAGWVAVGVNQSEAGMGAVVVAMSPEHALKAARMLFKLRYNKGDWTSLRIRTNDDNIVLSDRFQIRDYLKTGKPPGQGGNDEYIDA
jgi:ketosteroid isomerase-like protein